MNRRPSIGFRASLCAAAAAGLLWGCASGPVEAPESPTETPPREAGVEEPAPPEDLPPAEEVEALRRALDRALTEPEVLEAAEVFTECLGDGRLRSLQVFGSGVGIWEDRKQFVLSAAEVASLLTAVRDAGFASWKPTYGGKKQADPGKPERPGAIHATVVICRVAVTVDGRSKESVQLQKGDQFPPLRELADRLIDACRLQAASGVGADDLKDALEKISRGELAPETLSLLLHRKPERAAEDDDAAGFLLRVTGRTASASDYRPGAGYAEPRLLDLDDPEVGQVAADLAALDPAALPINLWAPDYTDFSVQVLNHKKTIQARQFAGMTPGSLGEAQDRFDRLYEALDELRRRVAAEGRPGP